MKIKNNSYQIIFLPLIMTPKKLILFFFSILISFHTYSQKDTMFWFAVPQIAHVHGGVISPVRAVFRIATYNQPADIVISVPANPGFTKKIKTIPANNLDSIDISADIQNAINNPLESYPYNQVLNKGVLITSTSPVNIYYDFGYWKNPEIFVLKGNSALGTDFIIPTQTRFDNTNDATVNPLARFSFDIVATKNNTLVTIKPTKNLIGHPAGIPFQIQLDSGQSYSAGAASTLGADHPAGTTVTSNNPIAITVKDESIVMASGWDVIGDQIVPVNFTGNQYMVIKGETAGSNDYVYITATKNKTKIWINNTLVSTINPGQTYEHHLTNAADYISTDYPVYAYQFSGVDVEAASALLPAMGCSGSTQVAIYRSSVTMSSALDLFLITKKGAENKFKLLSNGITVNLNGITFNSIPGVNNYVYAFFKVPAGLILPDHSYIISNDSLFTLGILGSNGVNGGASLGYISNIGSSVINYSITRFTNCSFWLEGIKPPNGNIYHYIWDFTPKDTFAVQVPPIINKVKMILQRVGGCTDSVITNITRVKEPVLKDVTVCKNNSYTFDASNTVATYKWFNGDVTPTITVKDTGEVWVKVAINDKDSSCPIKLSAHLSNWPDINPSAGKDTTICKGATIQLIAKPDGASKYEWSDGSQIFNGQNFSVSQNDSIKTYTVTITDLHLCIDSAKVKVTNYVFIPPQIDDATICSNVPKNVILSITNPVPTYIYNWYDQPLNGNLVHTGINDTLKNISTGTIFYIETIDPTKICSVPSRKKVEISLNTKPTAGTINYDPTNITQGVPVHFTSASLNVDGYNWFFGKNQGASPLKDPYYIYSDTGLFNVKLIVSKSNSGLTCYDTSITSLFVKPRLSIWIPEAFTPNNDGKNDFLFVRGPVKSMHFEIYNQWGYKVFSSDEQVMGWDGQYKGVVQPEGNYVWTLVVTTFDDVTEKFRGLITLIR